MIAPDATPRRSGTLGGGLRFPPATARAAVRGYWEEERLALYGWMDPEGASLLADPAAAWIDAAICGDAVDGCWSAGTPNGGLRLRAGAAPVRLRILCSRLLPRRWPLFDAWTGPAYRRVTAEADHAGLVLRTQIYVLKETGLY